MRKISKNSIILIILAFILMFPVVRTDAVIGNATTFIHSDDYFAGDKATINTYYTFFTGKGLNCRITSRPVRISGMKAEFINSESVYISCHGTNTGSELVLDAVNWTLFRATDVPPNMNCKLAYICACRAAQNSAATGQNLCNNLVKNGYRTAMGYKTNVPVDKSRMYDNIFFSFMGEGMTVNGALAATREYFMQRGEEEKYSAIISSMTVYGDRNLKLL